MFGVLASSEGTNVTMLGPREEWGATCENCEWSRTMRTELDAKVAMVLHMLDKHPDQYRISTGKDPDVARLEYAEMLRVYRKEL